MPNKRSTRRRSVHQPFNLEIFQHQFARLESELWAVGSSVPHMDGAFDKMLTKLGMLPDFPLRLLSPYTSFEESDYLAMKALLAE